MAAFYVSSESCFSLQIRLGDLGDATRFAHGMIAAITLLHPEHGQSVDVSGASCHFCHPDCRHVWWSRELLVSLWIADPLLAWTRVSIRCEVAVLDSPLEAVFLT